MHALLHLEHIAATGVVAKKSSWTEKDVLKRRIDFVEMLRSNDDAEKRTYVATRLFEYKNGMVSSTFL
jgi:hypothetical protein